MTKNTYNGFHKDFLKFLSDLKLNNNKDWFDKNRDFYDKEIKNTSKLFVFEIGNQFLEKGLPFVADTKISLFRINRDIRFSQNKDPYKTNIGIYFPYSINPETAKKSTPIGFYCHFEPESCFVAGGFYMPEPAELKHYRTRIYSDFEEFSKIIENKEFKSNFPEVLKMSEPLKKVPLGFPKEHQSAEFLKMKDLSYTCKIPTDLIHTNELIPFLIKKAEIITPFLTFLNND